MLETTKSKLDRELTDEEQEFLMWLYEKQQCEEKKTQINQDEYIK